MLCQMREKRVKTNVRPASPAIIQTEQNPVHLPDWLRPWMVIILALLILAPFLNKAVTIDDPLFIWQAQHLQQKPFDPFGFETNWFGVPQSMLTNVQNPPVTCYWLALAGLVSWKEAWLHLTLLPFALLTIWGVIQLARRFGADPFWAALLTLGSAGFLVSATNLMCDVMLTCGIVWSIFFWIKGLDRNKTWILVFAALLAGFTVLTKYFGISLIPLLAAYTIIRQKKLTWSLAPLLAAVAIVLGWHLWTMHMYHVSHILGAQKYAQYANQRFDDGGRYFSALTFLGGCILWPLVIALGRIRLFGWITFASTALIGGFILVQITDRLPIISYILAAIFFAGGIAVFWLTAEYHIKNRQYPETWLVALWVWGTLFFMIIVNWTVAARSLLPMIPALAILAATPGKPAGKTAVRKDLPPSIAAPLPLVPLATAAFLGLVLAVLATWGDFDWANGVRRTATNLTAKYRAAGKHVVFQGHWGFQYYMELAGATIQDIRHINDSPDEVAIIPFNNSNIYPQVLNGWNIAEEFRDEKTGSGFYLTDPMDCAGFYSHLIGLLPLAYSMDKPDRYYVMAPPMVAQTK
jgi:hypothetical protein